MASIDHMDQSFHQQWIIDMIILFISFISVLIVFIYFFVCRLTIRVRVFTDLFSSLNNFLFLFSVNRVIVDHNIPFFGDLIRRVLLTDILFILFGLLVLDSSDHLKWFLYWQSN